MSLFVLRNLSWTSNYNKSLKPAYMELRPIRFDYDLFPHFCRPREERAMTKLVMEQYKWVALDITRRAPWHLGVALQSNPHSFAPVFGSHTTNATCSLA